MNKDKECDLEVELILRKQYKRDCFKDCLIKIINKKRKENNFYTNLELLADVSLYYEKINDSIKITSEILKLNNSINNFELNSFLDLTWNKIEMNDIIQNDNKIDVEKINNLSNGYFTDISNFNKKNLKSIEL